MTAGGLRPHPVSRRLPRPTWLEWVLLAVGVVLTVQYAWLMDDAFVYFRYADNFLWAGRGLVYNAGEYVEGYSSPLWMLLLVAMRAIGLDWWLVVRLAGVAAFAVFWALLVVVARLGSPAGVVRINLPLLLLAPNYAVLCYFTSGLEAPLVQIAAAVFALAVLRPASPAAQIAAGWAPLVRHELALPLVLLALWCWWRNRRLPLPLLLGALSSTGAWLLFRVWYYADLLPNTFYLKDDWMPAQGLVYLADTAGPYGLVPVLGAALLAFVLLRFRDGRHSSGGIPRLLLAERAMMLLLAALVAAYVVKIGGDPRHYRYLAFPFCLAILATVGLVEHLQLRWSRRVPGWAFGIAAVVSLLIVGSRYPRQLDRHPLLGPAPQQPLTLEDRSGPEEIPFHLTVGMINDAAVHRHHPELEHDPWAGAAAADLKDAYRRAGMEPVDRPYDDIVIHHWCFTMYAEPDSRMINKFGLTDAFLGRTRMIAVRPAHKYGLKPFADDIERVLRAVDNRPHRGMFRRVVEGGDGKAWMRDNLDSIETIERKVYNRHDLGENLRLALAFPKPIEPPVKARGGAVAVSPPLPAAPPP
jgi:hypothetical protein